MADYRSKSFNDGNMQIQPYYGPPSTIRPPNDYGSYSLSYISSSSYHAAPPPPPPPLPAAVEPPQKLKKGKSRNGWSFNDPEFQRKRRVASYKAYSVEGKVKGSFRKSFRWLKHRFSRVLDRISLESAVDSVIRAYASNKAWVIGFLMDIFGAVLMLLALSQAPVSVIQPVSGCGLAILSVFSHFYLKEIMNAIDWVGITLAGIGTIGVGAGGEEQTVSSISVFQLPWLAFVVVLLFVLLNGWLRVYRRQRREQELMQYEVVEEIIYGLESGILFGLFLRENLLRTNFRIASVVSKMGFVFLEQGFSKLLLPVCISISICCSGSGFVYQTRGLKHGRAIVVSTCAAVASIVTGVLAGMLALGEQLPSAPVARLFLLLGWLLIILGVILLVTSTRLVRFVPRPWRRFARSGGIRQPSIRTRDANPSTVIQASTLHHLITSPSKAKG
ncbi:hypothetical protein BUALT_Bualt10G0126700 [Buddleja alternifolia]|uniref:Probable magnesium transporter n=1 Tax=Buddleja alternifolia TaxID=168488 RepID=A0AAV6X5H9_9LAMI|nr:hypothetical protein BUALT_Bualt10G0126700 [Buddleja alternifolia]